MSENTVTHDGLVLAKQHFCTTAHTYRGLRWLRRGLVFNGLAPVQYNDVLQQGTSCIECGKTYWTDVPIVTEEEASK